MNYDTDPVIGRAVRFPVPAASAPARSASPVRTTLLILVLIAAILGAAVLGTSGNIVAVALVLTAVAAAVRISHTAPAHGREDAHG